MFLTATKWTNTDLEHWLSKCGFWSSSIILQLESRLYPTCWIGTSVCRAQPKGVQQVLQVLLMCTLVHEPLKLELHRMCGITALASTKLDKRTPAQRNWKFLQTVTGESLIKHTQFSGIREKLHEMTNMCFLQKKKEFHSFWYLKTWKWLLILIWVRDTQKNTKMALHCVQ